MRERANSPNLGRPQAPSWLFWPFLFLILGAPAMLGANRPVAWSGLALGLGILLIGWALTAGRTAGGAPLPFRSLAPAAIPFFLAIAWALAQALPYVPPQLHDSAWAEAGAALGMALPGRISLAPEEAGTGIMRLLSYGAVLLLAAQLGHSARRAHAILWGVALAGGAYALYGLLVWADGNRLILWMAKWAYPDSLTSSFVSRNHYATYAGLGLCASLGLLAHALARQPRAGAHTGAALIPLALMMIAAALLLTRSRGGIASATLAVLVMTVLFAFGTEGRRTRMAFAAAALGLLAAGAGVLGGGVIARMAPEEVEDWGGRSDIWARAAAAALDRPLGGGLGAFADFFPAYRDLALGLQFGSLDKAHNLYLEMAAELGPTVAAALVLGLGWLVLRVIRGSLAANPGPALAAAGASVLVAVHSLADFSLQIPAVTATWLLLLGAALGQAQRAASLRATGRSRESAHKAPGDLPESPPRFASATDR